jgi:DNA-binding NarL/FixJ family response regulator
MAMMNRWMELDERELLVLMLLADGCTIAEIADEINRKDDTIKHIFHNIRWKLKAKNNTHAVAMAYHKGILKVRVHHE